MNHGVADVPVPINEPVLTYAPGTPERDELRDALGLLKASEVEVTAIIGGCEVRTGRTIDLRPPHESSHRLGVAHMCGADEVQRAIGAAIEARRDWARMPWEERASVFLKAADLLAGSWRARSNAATMLGQSKSVYQSEIDAACELIDFWRFNVHFAREIYAEQPVSSRGVWNRLQYRPLEGFVFAVTPFNFTSIGGNLPTAPALMGNVVIWKPASTALYSAYQTMLLLEEAGLPPGVINMVPGSGPDIGDPTFASEHLAGLHFTGSTGTFQHMWRTIGANIQGFRTYPRVVGETGGKDFILAHASADVSALATAMVRGAFEYQGQKCSAASRAYVPSSLWPEVRRELSAQLSQVRMGSVEDFGCFMNAVIDRPAFDKITGYIDRAREEGAEVVFGGGSSSDEGFFVEPTVLLTDDPKSLTMREEIFGPVLTVHTYDESRWHDVLRLVDGTSPYGLTGAVFAQDRSAIAEATVELENAAGNFYINDKPTGAVVGQQPFGGARGSGTNDKAGSALNLTRWVSARAIKETFEPARHFAYPFMDGDA